MNQLTVVILLLLLVPVHVEADASGSTDHHSSEYTHLQPSLAVVIGLLGVMSMISFLLLAYVKFCHRGESADRNPPQNNTRLISSSSNRFSGIDTTVIDSLPFFRFSSLKGSKEGLECAVCLSKFEDIEVLRLLPKCKHAFHNNCIDHWLESHSSCPLCRQKVSSEDLKLITYSNSMRFLWNEGSEIGENSNNIELFVEREESRRGSSRFSLGSSFRKIIHEKCLHKKEEMLIEKEVEPDQKVFHMHNHKIVASDFIFNNRWSNLSSSDLIFLNSEMLNDMSSSRFSSADWNNGRLSSGKAIGNEKIMKVKEEMDFVKLFQGKVGITSSSVSSTEMNSFEHRSVSEIVSLSRNGNFGVKNRITESCYVIENNVIEERIRRAWLPIARRTVRWFANREKSSERRSFDV